MPNKIYNIFDFDYTLTKGHTFALRSLECFFNSFDSIIPTGKADAQVNLKVGVDKIFKHDEGHLSAIATYHNNPLFIASFVAGLLKKEVTYLETIKSDVPGIAIDRYALEGIDTPLFISYIKGCHGAFNTTMRQLQKRGKNDQINDLRRVLLAEHQMEPNAVINFYDDTQTNFEQAKLLPQINGYLIDRENETFTIVGSFLCEAGLVDRTTIKAVLVDRTSLKAALISLNRLEFTKNAESIKPRIKKLIKKIEHVVSDSNIYILQDVVEKTYRLLKDPNSSLDEYRATAYAMRATPNRKLQMLGAVMLGLAFAIALVLLTLALAGAPVVSALILVPTLTTSAAALTLGGYSFFAAGEKGLDVEMSKIAEHEEAQRAPC